MVLWRLQELLELKPQKRCPLHHRGLECKSRKSEIPGVKGKFGFGVQNEAGQRLTEFCQKNTLVIANTLFQQHKKRLYTWTSPDSKYWNQIDNILCSQRWRSSIQSAKTRPGADCGSDHEPLIANFRLKLKKVGKTTRLFRYDINQIPYNYTVEVMNRFKGLDLVDRVPEEREQRFTTLYRRRWPKPSQRKRNARRQSSCLRGLINSWEKKRSKRQQRKGKIHPFECRVPENSKER